MLLVLLIVAGCGEAGPSGADADPAASDVAETRDSIPSSTPSSTSTSSSTDPTPDSFFAEVGGLFEDRTWSLIAARDIVSQDGRTDGTDALGVQLLFEAKKRTYVQHVTNFPTDVPSALSEVSETYLASARGLQEALDSALEVLSTSGDELDDDPVALAELRMSVESAEADLEVACTALQAAIVSEGGPVVDCIGSSDPRSTSSEFETIAGEAVEWKTGDLTVVVTTANPVTADQSADLMYLEIGAGVSIGWIDGLADPTTLEVDRLVGALDVNPDLGAWLSTVPVVDRVIRGVDDSVVDQSTFWDVTHRDGTMPALLTAPAGLQLGPGQAARLRIVEAGDRYVLIMTRVHVAAGSSADFVAGKLDELDALFEVELRP